MIILLFDEKYKIRPDCILLSNIYARRRLFFRGLRPAAFMTLVSQKTKQFAY